MDIQKFNGATSLRLQQIQHHTAQRIGPWTSVIIVVLLTACGENQNEPFNCEDCGDDIPLEYTCGGLRWDPPEERTDQDTRSNDDDRRSIDPAVLFANASPTANAGDRVKVAAGATVTLDGSGSNDGETTTLEYAWQQVSGPRVALSDAAVARPTFTAPPLVTQDTTLTFRLTVTDEVGEVDRDATQIDVSASVKQPPENGGRVARTLRGHTHIPLDPDDHGFTDPSISADGRLVLAKSSRYPTAHLWNAQTGELKQVLYHGDFLRHAVLSTDGRLALTGSTRSVALDDAPWGIAKLWDTATGELLHSWTMGMSFPEGGNGVSPSDAAISDMALSGDGHIALASSSRKEVGAWLWDTATGERLHVLAENRNRIDFVAVSANGKLALTRDEEGVRLWHVATGTELRQLAKGGAFTLSADGSLAMSGRSGGTNARIFNTTTGDELCVLNDDGESFKGALLSGDGGTALTGSEDGTVRAWDIATCGKPRVLGRHQGAIRDMALSDDGHIALTASEDGTARLWNVETGDELHALGGHEGIVHGTALSADGRIAVTTGEDNTVRLWSVDTGKQLHKLDNRQDGATVESVALSANGGLALTGGGDLTARLWNADTGEQQNTLGNHGIAPHSRISSVVVAMSADGSRRLTGSRRWASDRGNYDIQLWGTSTAEDPLRGHVDMWGMALTADGTVTLMGNSDGRAWLTNVSTDNFLYCLNGDYYVPMVDVALDAAGSLALTGSADGTARFWNLNLQTTGTLRHKLQAHETRISGVALSADGRFGLSAGGYDQTVRLWDVGTGEELHALAHAASVTDVAISTDGSLALTADSNGTAWLWDWDAPEGKQLYALRGHEKRITSVALNADGTTALTGSRDGTARVWEVTVGK